MTSFYLTNSKASHKNYPFHVTKWISYLFLGLATLNVIPKGNYFYAIYE